MLKKRGWLPPAVALYLLSPIVGELLSGSTPPAEFFTPFGFTVIVMLYGGGAVTVRELKVRWRKGMGSLLLLGAAYGVIEEGLMVASFQNPLWPDLGVLGVFGRWLGVNWVWAVELTAYHSIVSITVPIILVELAYSDRKAEPWLSGLWLKIVSGVLIGDVFIGFFIFTAFTGFWPSLPHYFFTAFITALLVFLAYKLPSDFIRRGDCPMRKPRHYLILTTLSALACGTVFWVLPNLLNFTLAPVLVIILGLMIVLGYIRYLTSFNWRNAITLHRFALAAGTLAPFIVFSFIQEIDRTRTDNTTGMALVGIIFLVGLTQLGRRCARNVC